MLDVTVGKTSVQENDVKSNCFLKFYRLLRYRNNIALLVLFPHSFPCSSQSFSDLSFSIVSQRARLIVTELAGDGVYGFLLFLAGKYRQSLLIAKVCITVLYLGMIVMSSRSYLRLPGDTLCFLGGFSPRYLMQVSD